MCFGTVNVWLLISDHCYLSKEFQVPTIPTGGLPTVGGQVPAESARDDANKIQVPISAVSTSSHSEQSSQARQSRWYCRNGWESRSVPNFIGEPLQETGGALSVLP